MLSELSLFLLFFSRFFAFFLISPLFSGQSIPKTIRFGLALVCSITLAPPLSIQFKLTVETPIFWILLIIREMAIGYLLGFLFSLIFEAAAFAGQLIGAMMGFSVTELLDPLATSSHPLIARFFSLFAFSLFLALDLHHSLLKFLFESFETFSFSNFNRREFMHGVYSIFHLALEFACLPFSILLILIVLFSLFSRSLQVFWLTFPLLLLIGMGTIAMNAGLFPSILEKGIYQFLESAKKIFF